MKNNVDILQTVAELQCISASITAIGMWMQKDLDADMPTPETIRDALNSVAFHIDRIADDLSEVQ